MNIVVTCGSPDADLASVASLLRAGGLAEPRPAHKDASVTIRAWHDRLIASQPRQGNKPVKASGKAWDQALGDIFVANWDQGCWGWSDPRSTWLLDYLAEYDSQICFVLVFDAPNVSLGRLFGGAADKDGTFAAGIRKWLAYNHELLQFYNRHADRSVLLDAEQCVRYPERFRDICRERLGLALDWGKDKPAISQSGLSPLDGFLVSELLSKHPQVAELYLEIRSSAPSLAPESEASEFAPGTARDSAITAAIADLVASRQSAAANIRQLDEQGKSARADAEKKARVIKELQHDNEQLSLRVKKSQEEYEKQSLQLKQQQKTAETERVQGKVLRDDLQKKIDEALGKANELKAELAESEKSRTALGKQLDDRQARLDQTDKALDGVNRQLVVAEDEKAELRKKLEQLRREHEETGDRLASSEKSNDELRQQLAGAGEEKARLQKALEDARCKLDEMEARLASAEKSRVDLGKQIAERQTQFAQLGKSRDDLQRQLVKANDDIAQLQKQADVQAKLGKRQSQEIELLLAQLHQVQEELERYYLQLEEQKTRKQEFEKRLKRVLTRTPNYCDWGSIETAAVSETRTRASVDWGVSDFWQSGRTIPRLHLRTQVHGGAPGLLLSRTGEPGSDAPLIRWPVANEGAKELVFVPEGNAPERAAGREILQGLATSDWIMLQSLCDAFIDMLQRVDGDPDAKHRGRRPNPAIWRPVLETLKRQIAGSMNVFRFDDVELHRQQVNPDYEHLWLKFSNVRFAGHHWPSYEFRIGAAEIQPGKFSSSPKLEFPLLGDGRKPLENWFEESHDDFGPKTELRFQLKGAQMDMAVWNKLSQQDRMLVLSLVSRLPAILALLEKGSVKAERPFAEWSALVDAMANVMWKWLAPGQPAGAALEQFEAAGGQTVAGHSRAVPGRAR